MIVKTPAIVLRPIKYGETSRIVTLFTRDHGRVSVMAKGARRTPNRFGSSLQPGSVTLVVYYSKESRELQILTQSDPLHRYRRIHTSLEATTSMLQMVEVLYAFTHANDPHPELYDFAVRGFEALEEGDGGIPQILLWYRWGIAARLGFRPTLDICVRCSQAVNPKPEDEVRFHVVKGGPVCASCTAVMLSSRNRSSDESWTDHILDGASLSSLVKLTGSGPGEAREVPLSERTRNQLENMTRFYERYHFDRSHPLRTSSMVREVIR